MAPANGCSKNIVIPSRRSADTLLDVRETFTSITVL
jgi:hypothetical protein